MKGRLVQQLTKDIARLGSPREEVARRAEQRLLHSAARLRRYGPKAIDLLIEATTHSDPQVRFRSVWVLAATRAPGACATILARTHDPDPAVRYDAAMALGRFGYTEAIQPLIDLACQPPREDSVENAAAIALIRLGRPALPDLFALAKHEDPWARHLAAWGLGRIGSGAAIEPMAALLQDRDENVRRRAVEALEKIGERCGDPQCFELIAGCSHSPDEWIRHEAAFWRKRGYGEPE